MLRLPQGLPAVEMLRAEGHAVAEYNLRAVPTDARVVLLLNLMPQKAVTELDIARALSFPDTDVLLLPVRIAGQTYKTTPIEYILSYYLDIESVLSNKLHLSSAPSLIITGAPVEQMPFESVRYWPQLCEIMDWAFRQRLNTLYICWGAQAGLYHHYGIPKYDKTAKCFGIFSQDVLDDKCPLMRGLSPAFFMPNSRHTEVRRSDFSAPQLQIVAESQESGVGVAYDAAHRSTFIVGHLEYEPHTLENEYKRDLAKGLSILPPQHYYEADDPNGRILWQWKEHARQFYRNWLEL